MAGLGELPLLSALKTKMRWQEARQSVLAENVANAATPGFQAHDLKPVEEAASSVAPMQTNARHLSLASAAGDAPRVGSGFERTPDGNTVVLEEQMTKAAQNQMDHQMAAMLYQKSLGVLRAALGRA
ncbi:flagellar basal body protein [Hansschlegelia sp.]|uniref:flagellar basal body protein n=1 Tax=Hansschlegelia sp. TaxID=2041892 RepID=UPI002B852C95|nr:flagellar basal body protein [Hansschlegelia sp.]HVI30348.1 flagellar basal body protein [Hansschlegelia sp.]